MTDTITTPDPVKASRGRRPRAAIVGMTALVVALAAAVAVPIWYAMASSASAQVQALPATAMVCNGKVVPYRITGEDGAKPHSAFVIPIEKGMACQFTVNVTNNSSHTIKVRDLKFPALRAGAGNAGPMIIAGQDSGEKFHGSDYDNDATYDVGESIGPGESADYPFRLNANPRACSDSGVSYSINFPDAHITVLGQHRTVHGEVSIEVRNKRKLSGLGCNN